MGACTTAPEKIRIGPSSLPLYRVLSSRRARSTEWNILICSVTELLEGDVEHLLHDKSKDLSLYFRMKMAKDAAQGMAWLHGTEEICSISFFEL
jgi:hypothetical protein